jgi:hypothetical protein
VAVPCVLAGCLDSDGSDSSSNSLAQLAERSASGDHRRPSRKLVELQPSAVLRAGLQGYRTLHVATNEMWLAEMLDVDGPRLARAALKLVGRSTRPKPAAAVDEAASRGDALQPGVARPSAARQPTGSRPAAPTEPRAPDGVDRDWVAWLMVLAFLGAIVAAFWARRAPVLRR